MDKLSKIIWVALLLLVMPLKQFAQQPKQTKLTDYNFHNLGSIEERVFLLHSIQESDIFSYQLSDNESKIDIYVSEDYSCQDSNANADFDFFLESLYDDWVAYSNLDKNERGSLFVEWRYQLEDQVFLAINEDFHRQLRDGNSSCDGADPFCTDNGLYQFPAGTNAGNLGGSQTPPYYCSNFVRPTGYSTSCLYTTPNPAFYYMQIDQPGNLNIYMYSTPSHDIDFDCWGPFADITTACSQLSCSNMVDCSYSASATENCYINNAQTGQYYILLITNYSNQPCNISFSNIGTGTTNCDILPPLVNNDGPYCVGETIYLTAQGQAGASYSWTGPSGFSSNQQNPTRPNCTMAMSGTYTCTITVGTQTNSATTEVVVYPMPTANFNYTSVCRGTPTQFTSTSTTNPSGQQIQSYQWNFGDGQSGTGANVTHTYANAGNYNVTLTVSTGNGHCTHQRTQTVPVYAAPVASATAQPNTVIYGGTATLSASAGVTGSFNFHWEPANMVVNPNAQMTQTVPLQATQTYTVTVTNPQGGCSSTAQVTVSMEGSNMTALASADQYELCEGSSTTLHAQPSGGTGNYTYSWTPANTLDNPNIQNPTATPPVGTTTYTCTVSDGITGQNVSVTILVHPNMESNIYQTICENDTYEFFDHYLQAPGVYDHTIQTQYGCDSTIHLHLDNYPVYNDNPVIYEFICSGESYDFFGHQYNYSTQASETLHSIHGCDSIIRLNLTVYPPNDTILIEPGICIGQSYNFHGNFFSQDGDIAYFDTIDNHGCLQVEKLVLSVGQYQMPPIQNEYVCYAHDETPSFYWDKNGQTYTEDTYDEIILPDPNGGCDFKYRLNLKFHQEFYQPQLVTECDEYVWPITGQRYTESTIVVQSYGMGGGTNFNCDSTYVLNLTIHKSDHNGHVYESGVCDEFYWPTSGETYTHYGDYSFDLQTTHGCDSTVTLHIDNDINYTPDPTAIYPVDASDTAPHWVITATEFQINSYDFNLWDNNPNCRWDTVIWRCPQAPEWLLEPFNEKGKCCKLYVLNYVADTIWLKARAFNNCAPHDGIERNYWLLCSFYGIEEQSQSLADFTVVPNPNNGQMTLNFEYLTGKVNVKVYDMTGNLIDDFQTFNDNEYSTMQYDMRRHADGIYFFVATGKEGTVAKKVVIRR